VGLYGEDAIYMCAAGENPLGNKTLRSVTPRRRLSNIKILYIKIILENDFRKMAIYNIYNLN
jgi:hypothetical protein